MLSWLFYLVYQLSFFTAHPSPYISLENSLTLLSLLATCGTHICCGIALLVHGYGVHDAQPGPPWGCPQTMIIAFSSSYLQPLILPLAAQLALNNICWMNELGLVGGDGSRCGKTVTLWKEDLPEHQWNDMKWSASAWEAQLAVLGGDRSPITLCIWMWTKIESEKLDYNCYQLSNYVFDLDCLRKLMNIFKGLIWVCK